MGVIVEVVSPSDVTVVDGDTPTLVVEVVKPSAEAIETTSTATSVEVVRTAEPTVVDEAVTSRVVEVVRGETSPIETAANEAVVDVVRPGGTVVNVQGGPILPPNPYDGQIWILTQ